MLELLDIGNYGKKKVSHEPNEEKVWGAESKGNKPHKKCRLKDIVN